MLTNQHFYKRLGFVALFAIPDLLSAAAPYVSGLRATSAVFRQPVAFHADVADADGNLSSVSFYVSGPGLTGNQLEQPATTVSGLTAGVDATWTGAPGYGVYTVTVSVADATLATGSASATFDVLMDSTTLGPITFTAPQPWMLERNGQIVTLENDGAVSVNVGSTASVIFWSGGRIDLKPGFKATQGSFFWAAIDHDMNGYSDMEEATDTDGDGIPDAWEVDHGTNPLVKDATSLAADGSGLTNAQEYALRLDPTQKSDDTALPAGAQVVLTTPGPAYFKVDAAWAITTAAAP